MARISTEDEAELTVVWLERVRDAGFQEELKYVPRFDDTTGSLKLVLDESLPLEGEVIQGMTGSEVEKFHPTTPVTIVDLDESYYTETQLEKVSPPKSLEEECNEFMDALSSSLEEFQNCMNQRWEELMAPLEFLPPYEGFEDSLVGDLALVESGAQE